LTPTAAATLALLWSCRGDEIHFAVVGSDTRATPSPTPDHEPPSSSSSSSSSSLSTKTPSDNQTISTQPSKTTAASPENKTVPKKEKSQSPDKDKKDEKAKSDAKKKRQIHQTIMTLPSNQLATALLVLGFSRVSIIKGVGLPFDQMPDPCLPEQFHDLIPALRSKTDGYAALVYHLCKLGAVVTGTVFFVLMVLFLRLY
jgi:hypothetical protein